MLLDRLFFLAVRQVSKPVAAIVRGAALESDILKGFLSSMGQGVHRLRIWATRRAEGKTATHVTPLAADRAVEGGADLLSEFVIYSVAAVTIAWQYDSDQRKKDKKEADEKAKEVQRIAEAQKNEKAQWDRINEFGRRITLMQEEIVILRSEERQRQQGGWFGKRVDSPDDIRERLTRARTELKSGQDGAS